MPSATPLSSKAYAKHRGCTQPTVLAAISSGRLEKSVKKFGNGYHIDPVLADAEWAANTDTGSGRPGHAAQQPAPQPNADGDTPITYAEARAQHERFKARLAQLELEEREGKLVQVDDVKRESFRVARMVRDSLLNLPDRVAGELAAETNQFKVHQRLVLELRRALEELKLD